MQPVSSTSVFDCDHSAKCRDSVAASVAKSPGDFGAAISPVDVFESPGNSTGEPAVAAANRYRETQDASSWAKSILKAILKVTWQYGGQPDSVDNKPRITGQSIRPLLKHLRPGDIIINGNNGGLTHLLMYAGDGDIIHSMATHNTMLGVWGSLYDNARRMLGYGPQKELVGVLKENMTDFFDRYERDSYVVIRDTQLTAQQISQGVEALEKLVGKEYDYDFSAGDDEYYCTELAVEFLTAATGEEPVFNTRHVTVPGLLDTHAIEPHHLLEADFVTPLYANQSAVDSWEEKLKGASLIEAGA